MAEQVAERAANPSFERTSRISRAWKISRNPGSNWRAIHAGGALFFGLLFAVVSLSSVLVATPSLITPLAFLAGAVLFLAYWRYLLPKAQHISNVRRILCGEGPQ